MQAWFEGLSQTLGQLPPPQFIKVMERIHPLWHDRRELFGAGFLTYHRAILATFDASLKFANSSLLQFVESNPNPFKLPNSYQDIRDAKVYSNTLEFWHRTIPERLAIPDMADPAKALSTFAFWQLHKVMDEGFALWESSFGSPPADWRPHI